MLIADLVERLRERHRALDAMPNRERAAALFNSDIAHLKIEFGDKVAREAVLIALAEPRPRP